MTEEREKLFPRYKLPSLWCRFKWKAEAVWVFIRNIPSNIRMICEWVPILWSSWDWDYNFLLRIMQYKMKRMSFCIRANEFIVKANEVGDQLDECVEIIERLVGNYDYTEAETKAHRDKWGEIQYDLIPVEGSSYSRLDTYSQKARDEKTETQEREENLAIIRLDKKRRQEDFDRLFVVMRDKIQIWWD